MPRAASSASMPSFVTPMAARLVETLPEGDGWMYEVKFDGYRALLVKNGSNVHLRSRNNKDLTNAYPAVMAAAARLRAPQAIVDGEIVAVGADGRPSFQALQHRTAHPTHVPAFYAFDLLHLNGHDLTGQPLVDRRRQLAGVLEDSAILLSIELPGTADHVVEAVRALGLEGIVAKRRDSRYVPGERSSAWLKVKLDKQQEFVVGGYRPGPHGVDALLVGTTTAERSRLRAKSGQASPRACGATSPMRSATCTCRCPFADLPTGKTSHWGGGVTAEQMAEMQWVKPTSVVQIRFVEWTGEGTCAMRLFSACERTNPPRLYAVRPDRVALSRSNSRVSSRVFDDDARHASQATPVILLVAEGIVGPALDEAPTYILDRNSTDEPDDGSCAPGSYTRVAVSPTTTGSGWFCAEAGEPASR